MTERIDMMFTVTDINYKIEIDFDRVNMLNMRNKIKKRVDLYVDRLSNYITEFGEKFSVDVTDELSKCNELKRIELNKIITDNVDNTVIDKNNIDRSKYLYKVIFTDNKVRYIIADSLLSLTEVDLRLSSHEFYINETTVKSIELISNENEVRQGEPKLYII